MGLIVNDSYTMRVPRARDTRAPGASELGTRLGVLKRHAGIYGTRPKNMWRTKMYGATVKESFHQAAMGMQLFIPVMAYSASKQAPGEKLSSFSAEMAGIGTHGLMSAGMGAVLSMLPGASMLPPGARAFAAVMLSSMPNLAITEGLNRGLNLMSSTERRIKRLEMGGGYEDSETSVAMRMAAVQAMNSAQGASRRYLGNEATFFHG